MSWVILEEDPPSRREHFVLVAHADTVMEAELLASELRNAGIHAMALSAGDVYMAERGMVWVPEIQRLTAIKFLEAIQAESVREDE